MLPVAAILIALALATLDPPHPPEQAWAARYSPGVMKRVAIKRGLEFRGLPGQCGMTIDWAPLGSFILVTGDRTGVSRVCESVDVSQTFHPNGGESDQERHVRNRMVELDAKSAWYICGAAVYKSGWRECPVHISKIPKSPNPARSPLGS